MNGTWKQVGTVLAVALGLTFASSSSLHAQAAAAGGQDSTKQPYTLVEYNAEQACAAEKAPATQVKCLDDFVAKYPNSALLIYVYPLYVNAYNQLKNQDKVMEYADKTVGLGDKVEAVVRYQVLYARALAYATLKPDAQAAGAAKAREAAKAGLKALDEVKKPDNVTDEDFKKQKQQPTILFHFTCATAAMAGKDYPGAVECYKAILALNPDDLSTNYNLGKAYMAMTPPQQMDAFWYFAKAVTSKGATQAQSNQVKKYLRSLIANFQGGNVCDSLTDGEMNELLQLAGSSADRPSSYTLPSAADISAIQKDMTIASVFTDLKAGGDKSKLTWLAACGLEFPEVPGKVIEVTPGDPIVLKIAFVTSDAEFEAATTPNMDVKVVGQPEAARVEKASAVHFTGTLVAYDPDPAFFLHWDKAKVKAEDIPKEKGAPKKPPVRRPTKKPRGR
ncbi:MAG TPA: tetratricopeptide repeat protein [Candidatus Acidoferrum sp.]|nr:tetratricopeptide repeat protein [Candidatus Acidoferrum sp.]